MSGAPTGAARERVVVAMSGGVDSSLAAALVARESVDAVGITLHLAGSASRCCSLDDVDDARRVADSLGLRFYVMNEKQRFREEVMEPFADAYLEGRTPIPCVTCNKRFKFDALLERARALGAERVATGHFARVEHDPQTGRHFLLRGRDPGKDQSYFLFQLDQAQLARCWFPLGECTKQEVRDAARALGLTTADKPESNEICFVPEGDYARVVETLRPEAAGQGGEIVDGQGRVLGRHAGVHHFTVGQRRGLGVGGESGGGKWYVTGIDAPSQRVTVGRVEALAHRKARVADVHWIDGAPPPARIRASVQVRHRHRAQFAWVEPASDRRATVLFDEAVRAVAPGQAAVFYDGDRVLGGGWIEGAEP